MTSYWAEHAWLPRGLTEKVRIVVHEGLIKDIETGTEPTSADVRLRGVVLPGFANTHSHAFHRALRGRTNDDGGNFWSWRDQMFRAAARLNPDNYLALARAVYCEMAMAGYTVVGEFHYLHHRPGGRPYGDPNAMGHALKQAASEAGIRLTLLDTCYLTGGLTGEGPLPLDETQTRFADLSADDWADRMSRRIATDRFRLGAAIHSVRSVNRDDIGQIVDVVAETELPLHVHVSEQPAENAACQLYHGCTPTELLDDLGALGPRTTAIHATHLTDRDVQLLGATQTGVCLCPTTERDLADGIGPARALQDAGSPLSLGSDEHVVVDAFEEVRALEMHERLLTNERGRFSTADLIMAGTFNGYRALGWDDGGHLSKGALADWIVVDPVSINTAGTMPGQIVYAATTSDIETVVVGGSVIASGGQHRLGPIGPMLSSAITAIWDD